MLIQFTDPGILKDYPHPAPPKIRILEMVPGTDNVYKASAYTVYEMDLGTPEAGNGRLGGKN